MFSANEVFSANLLSVKEKLTDSIHLPLRLRELPKQMLVCVPFSPLCFFPPNLPTLSSVHHVTALAMHDNLSHAHQLFALQSKIIMLLVKTVCI